MEFVGLVARDLTPLFCLYLYKWRLSKAAMLVVVSKIDIDRGMSRINCSSTDDYLQISRKLRESRGNMCMKKILKTLISATYLKSIEIENGMALNSDTSKLVHYAITVTKLYRNRWVPKPKSIYVQGIKDKDLEKKLVEKWP